MQPRMISGPGGGLSDMVPAVVDGERPAALSSGEFVWPADVVSYIGDGSSEAGARILTQVMNRIRELKVGSPVQAKGLLELIEEELS